MHTICIYIYIYTYNIYTYRERERERHTHIYIYRERERLVLEESLPALNLSYVDLLLMHWPCQDTPHVRPRP